MRPLDTRKVSIFIVGGTIGLFLMWYIWFVAPIPQFVKIGCNILLLWEGYTLVNKQKGDTLTDALIHLAGLQQLVPLLFGAIFGYLIGADIMTDPIINIMVGGLLGHFFFFSQGKKQVEAIKEVIEEVIENKVG